MANSILTPTMVTREALRILHQKLNFVGRVNRQYDDSFANSGAKIGDSLKIRLPNQYTVRTGAVMSTQATSESSTTLQISTQKGVDISFSSSELTLSLDDFSKRVLAPAMTVLAANIESDALNTMVKDVYNQVNNTGSAATFNKLLGVRKQLVDNLTPVDDNLSMVLNTQDNVDVITDVKGLFQDSQAIKTQYRDGFMGRTAGFEFYENTLLSKFTPGSETAAGTITINGANQTGSAITVTNGSSKTLKAGDIITLPGVNRVHPETKADTGVAMTFVVTADVASSGTTINISPAVVTSGATQNVTASPTNTSAITKQGTASTAYGISLGFHRDAFAFATADLQMPKGVDFAAREVQDGISLRIVRQFDVVNDLFPCRIDVLYGYKTIRPQLACRFANN